MKGEYVEPKPETPTNMFSKLHHNHNHNHNHPFSHHFHLSRDNTPDSSDTNPPPQNPSSTAGDGASIEVARRPRGRPPGSKNKPKPPVFVTQETDPPMNPYILEIPSGNDVVDAVSRFCRRKGIGVCVLTASGAVSNVTLRQPSTSTPGSTVTFHGRFDILSLSATFLPPAPPPQTASYPDVFTISLAGPQGQIVGGFVAGELMAAGNVYIIAASFNNPVYHRLPLEDETVAGSGEGQSPQVSVGGDCGGGELVPMYSSDVIWAPTAARAPQQPPY